MSQPSERLATFETQPLKLKEEKNYIEKSIKKNETFSLRVLCLCGEKNKPRNAPRAQRFYFYEININGWFYNFYTLIDDFKSCIKK